MFVQHKRSLVFAAFSLLALGAPRGARATDWPQLGLDGGRGRASTEISGSMFLPAWKVTASAGPIVASEAVADGYVVVAGSKGELRGLHAVDGSEAWTVKADGALGASPAIDHGRVFVSTLSGQLQALRLSDGQALWKRPVGGQNYGSPVMIEDQLGRGVLVAAGFPAQTFVRVSAATGALQWETAPGTIASLVSSSPALVGGQVLFGSNGGATQSLNLSTGVTGWQAAGKGGGGMSSPLVIGGTAYFVPGGRDSGVYAIDVASGSVLTGWPLNVVDASAPAAATFGSSRYAVSSPVRLGDRVVFVARFEYDLKATLPGSEGLHLLREYLVAVNTVVPGVAWQQEIGRLDATSINEVPELNMAPTPASFAAIGGGALVVTASSITAQVRVFDETGKQLWNAPLTGRTRSAPVFANGLLLVATDAGVVHAFASQVNRAPAAPTDGFDPVDGQMIDGAALTLRWSPAQDPDSHDLGYQVRIDGDGEVLENWLTQIDSQPGDALVTVPRGLLTAGQSYSYWVRSRDEMGAWSAWSTAHKFVAAVTPSIDVAGTKYDTLEQAVAAVPVTGGIINLGPGLLPLHAPVQLPAGVALVGASPQDTVLNATGLSTGIQISASGRTGGAQLKNLTVTGADVGVSVIDVDNAELRNVVLRDNHNAGLQVGEAGGATAVNVTIVRNGVGAAVQGKLAIRSSIVAQNDTGLQRLSAGVVQSRFNNLVANKIADYQDVEAGLGDISAVVTFRSTADFHFVGLQPTTDRGDPADAYGLEPAPNGGRVNMGAFGNTPTAELSAASAAWSASAGSPSPLASDTKASVGSNRGVASSGGSGCAVSGAPQPAGAWLLLAVGAILIARRRRA